MFCGQSGPVGRVVACVVPWPALCTRAQPSQRLPPRDMAAAPRRITLRGARAWAGLRAEARHCARRCAWGACRAPRGRAPEPGAEVFRTMLRRPSVGRRRIRPACPRRGSGRRALADRPGACELSCAQFDPKLPARADRNAGRHAAPGTRRNHVCAWGRGRERARERAS